ncbi:MAG: hypothetical protein IH796_11605 [Deltaproteobacteria bacterium]|nr:hypothetical protein [Deltaproteobacteria bacterium]
MENRSVDRIGPSIAPLLQSPMLQGAVRPNVQCSIAPGRVAPLCGPLLYCTIVSGREAPCVAAAVVLWHK